MIDLVFYPGFEFQKFLLTDIAAFEHRFLNPHTVALENFDHPIAVTIVHNIKTDQAKHVQFSQENGLYSRSGSSK